MGHLPLAQGPGEGYRSPVSTASVTTARVAQKAMPFLPEQLTPLFFTPSYVTLSPSQKLRYNQLHGLYFNEQIAFFEEGVGAELLPALIADSELGALRESLGHFLEEERRHTTMFRKLNRRTAPELYGGVDSYFIQVPAILGALLGWMTRRPRWFPMFLWLMLLQEERSLYYSREILKGGCELDPSFVATHRAHLADEVDHVRWDEQLLDQLWANSSPGLRRANATLFRWMLAEFFYTPKRGQVRVLEQLANEYPELGPRLPELRRQMLALRLDKDYRATLYSRRIVPRTFARFDQWPEFGSLLHMLEGS